MLSNDLERAVLRANAKRDIAARIRRALPDVADQRVVLLDLLADLESFTSKLPLSAPANGQGKLPPLPVPVPAMPRKETTTQKTAEVLAANRGGMTTGEVAEALFPREKEGKKRTQRARNALRWLQESDRAEYRSSKWFIKKGAEKIPEKKMGQMPHKIVAIIAARGGTATTREIVFDLEHRSNGSLNKTHIYNTLARISRSGGMLIKSERDGSTVYSLANGGQN